MNLTFPFIIDTLPYSLSALEPYINSETLDVHFNRLLQAYVENLNRALSGYPEFYNWSLETILTNIDLFPSSIQESVKNNAGGVYNHLLYFNCLTPPENSKMSTEFSMRIKKDFGSIEWFQDILKSTAMKVFGSGYAWLVITPTGYLATILTKNQDTPLPNGLFPLLNLDVWEHAYFLQYLNQRSNYIDAWFHVVNWQYVESRYNDAMAQTRK